MANQHTSNVQFCRETRDYEVTVDGAVVGYADSPALGRQLAANFVADLQAWEDRVAAEEAAAAPVVALATPAAEQAAASKIAHVTRQTVAAAAEQAAQAVEDPRWRRAIKKAVDQLSSNVWAFYGEALQVTSSRSHLRHYMVTANYCPCEAFQKAGRPCWHRAGLRILQRAAELGAQAAA